MAKTFQDRNFLVWEAYPSGGRHGASEHPHVVFQCLTQRDIRPRFLRAGMHEADAERLVAEASPADLLEMLERADDLA
jgi:hypothetical protein